MFDFFEFENSNFVNVIKWRTRNMEVVYLKKIMKLSTLQHFHLKPFAIFN
jgi:hypothetical protein